MVLAVELPPGPSPGPPDRAPLVTPVCLQTPPIDSVDNDLPDGRAAKGANSGQQDGHADQHGRGVPHIADRQDRGHADSDRKSVV